MNFFDGKQLKFVNSGCYTPPEHRFTPCLSASSPLGRHRGTVPRRLRWKRRLRGPFCTF
jgi:hypothetical protein